MRQLTEDETKTFFAKLAQYIGRNISFLVDQRGDPHSFVFHREKVYYASDQLIKAANGIKRKSLLCIGTCFGKFEPSGKFRLRITCLGYLARYASYKVWLKKKAEMSYLYGNPVLKAHVEKTTENIPRNQCIVVLSEDNVPLGFGVSVKPGEFLDKMLPIDNFIINQEDTGEYLRNEKLI